jgi:hypothetical protein
MGATPGAREALGPQITLASENDTDGSGILLRFLASVRSSRGTRVAASASGLLKRFGWQAGRAFLLLDQGADDMDGPDRR